MAEASSSKLPATEPQPSSSTKETWPMLFTDCHNRIRLVYKIGFYSANRLSEELYLPVYKAIRIFSNTDHYAGMTIDDVVIVVKYVKTNTPEYCYLIESARRSIVKAPTHPNLIRILDPLYDNNYYVISFPFMRGGSIRHILKTKYPNGMPEDWILLILNAVLSALSALHNKTMVHREVHAGNIFLSAEPNIKLAYAASVYTSEEVVESSDYLPEYKMVNWAKAPQVYNCREEYFVPSQDIWMVGITAMELACGRLWVKDREGFENAIKEINRKQQFPKKGKRRVFQIKSENFSKSFERLVVKCLAWEIDERPTADQLLQWSIFQGIIPMWSAIKAAPDLDVQI